MSSQISDIADLPLHIRSQFGVTFLHAGDDALADVHIDDGFDAPIVDIGRQPRITATDIHNRIFRSYVFVENPTKLWVLSIPDHVRFELQIIKI